MTFFLRRRIRVDRHLGIDDGWSDHRVWMRYGFWLLDHAGITRARFGFRGRDRPIGWRRYTRRRRWYGTNIRCHGL